MQCISLHTITSATILRFWLTYIIFNHHLNVIVSIRVYDDAASLKNAPPDHVIPHSDHEDPRRPATRLEYVAPGHWVKLSPGRDFIPTRTYAQVRHRDTVKKVPREEAFRDAKTDEERENAARLKEAVSKWKSNTYYKEEGYEDAAYDHGGHEKNADFDEGYKSHAAKPKNTGESHENSENIDPKSFVSSEIAKLNENLENEYGEAAKRTQVEVPENLRDVASDEESSENTSRQEDDGYEDRSSESPAIAEATTVASDYIATPGQTEMGPLVLRSREKFNSISGADFNPGIRALSSSEDSSSSTDYGKKLSLFSHYKPEKPAKTLATTADSPKSTETPFQESTKSLENPEDYYPSLAKIYDAWKKEGIEHIYLKPFSEQEVSASSQKTNSSDEEDVATSQSEEKTLKKNWNKPYTLIIRAPTTPCNSSQAPEVYLLDNTVDSAPNHTGNSVAEVIKTVDGQNLVVMQPPSPQPLGQVTYADFLLGNGPGRPSMTQESGSIQETNPGPSMGPSSPSLYRYYRHQQRHRPPRMTDQDFRRRLVRLIMMLPPSPVKSSQYAQYRRRNGDARPPQHDLWPQIFRNYKPVYRLHEKIDNNVGATVALARPPKIISLSDTSLKSAATRRKRNLELLDNAPEIVQDIIGEELRTRFPEEKNIETSENNSENDRVEIQVPEYNFSAISEDQEEEKSKTKFQEVLDTEKYPFYNDEKISDSSALKYAVAPHQVPRKTLGGTEFYDSRDRYMECDEIDPDLSDVAAEKGESEDNQDPPIRLEGLGDKLSCYQAKYFDRNPLDNPLFTEKQISPPALPGELDIPSLRARLSTLSDESEPTITRRMSRKPEILYSNTGSRKNEIISDKKRNKWSNHARRYRKRHPITTSAPSVKLYEKQVYEDVMGTIKNQANMHEARPRLRAISIYPRPRNQTNQLTFKSTGAALPGPLSPSARYKTMSHSVNTYRGSKPRGETADHIIGYIRRVRVHKRSINSVPTKSPIFSSSSAKQTRQPIDTSVPETSSRPSEKVVYTIRDLIRHSKPRGSTRFSDFPASSSAASIDSRRNEPRYTPIRKLDDDIYKVKYQEKNNRAEGVEDQGEINGRVRKKGKKRYDVHENIEEEQPGGLVISDKMEESSAAGDDTPPANESEEIEKPAAYGNILEKDAEKDSEKNEKEEEDEEEQLEKPSNYYSEDSCDGSGEGDDNEESSDHQEEDTDVTEEPDGEKEFDAFVGQPFSHFGSFEHDKFSSSGQGVNKPAFYKPSFMSFTSHKPWKYHGPSRDDSTEQTSSKYVFPWHADDSDASEESRRYEKTLGRHEFPWERRQRLAKEREKFQVANPSDEELDNSETMIDLKRIQPWTSHHWPASSHGWFANSFDGFEFSTRFPSTTFHGQFPENTEKPSIEVENIGGGKTGEEMVKKTTPFVRQIPPTASVPASTPTQESTTPTTKIFSSAPDYRVRSRAKARKITSESVQPSIAPVTTNPSTPRLSRRPGQSARRLKQYNNPQRRELITNNRRSSRMTSAMSSTTPSSSRRISTNNSQDKSVIPTSKNVERRSKMSTEEIFTETLYPELDKSHPKMGVVKKISIVTKHTPKHIFRTEEINKNGVKDIFMSIIPNNSTENSLEIDRSDIKFFSDIEHNIPPRFQEINLPVVDDPVKLIDYDPETILSQMYTV